MNRPPFISQEIKSVGVQLFGKQACSVRRERERHDGQVRKGLASAKARAERAAGEK